MDTIPMQAAVEAPLRAKVTVTAIPGDGIGPEVMRATQTVLAAAGARVEWEEALAGAEAFRRGIAAGATKETLDSIARNGVALKGPLETPVGFGDKSANVTLRKTFEMYGNIRPVRELPGIRTPFSGRGIDFVVVRENVEDVYAGIEHMQTPGVAQCLKIITEVGCERIVRLAAAVAEAEGRKKVTVATKANIMKLTEGMLKRSAEQVMPDYPGLQHEHMIVDNCAHQMVIRPEQFVVTGFRPDFGFLAEVRLDLDPALGSPRTLADQIHPDHHSCGDVAPHGYRELAQPEQGLYLVGMKSYGRAPSFLAMTGYEQVRSVVAALDGDLAAAGRVELVLPETGVCNGAGVFDDPDAASGGGCCGAPAASEPQLITLGGPAQ